MTSQAPEGFRRVTFSVTSDDGHSLPAQVSCLVCNMCQAMLLQNELDDFVYGHRMWHQHIDELFKAHDKLKLIDEAALESGTKTYLDAQAEWEKTDTLKSTKRR